MKGQIRKRSRLKAKGKETATWYVVFDAGRDETGKRKQKWIGGFGTRKEAEGACTKTVNEINRGSYITPTKSTLQEWLCDEWLPMMKSQVKTSIWHSYKRNIELHVVPYIGDRVLKDVNASVLNKLYENLLADGKKNANEGLSAKTVRHIHTTIHKALSDAVDADILGINPATKAKPPKPRATATDKLNFWRVDELAAFLRHVEAHVWKRFGTYLR